MNIDLLDDNIYKYITDEMNLADDEITSIKVAVNMIHEISPTDIPLIMKRVSDLIVAEEDLSWTITAVNKVLIKLKYEIKSIKAPQFTLLTRQGRPSSTAIEYEIFFTNDKLKELEVKKDNIENILEYLRHIEKSLDTYIYLLRDKLKYS